MKKTSKLVLATMLAAGTVMVSGCIENLEPADLTDLREAKIELLQAQAAFQAAQTAKLEAETALAMANVKIVEAKAKQEEAKVAYETALALQAQYEAEYQKLKNEAYAQEQEDEHNRRAAELEALLAENEAKLAEATRAAELAAAELEYELLVVQTSVLKAQALYEQAVKDLKVAAVELTDKQQQYILPYKSAVQSWKARVDELTYNLAGQAKELARRIAVLDKAKADSAAIRDQKWQVIAKEAALEAAKEAEAKAEEMLNLDPALTDWEALRADLEAQLKALDVEKVAKTLAMEESSLTWREALDAVSESAEKYASVTGLAWDCTVDENGVNGTGLFSIVPGKKQPIELPEMYVAYPYGDAFVWNEDDVYYYGKEGDVLKKFENELTKVSVFETYELPFKQYRLAANKEYAEAYLAGELAEQLQKYEDMLEAYKTSEYLPYANKYIFSDEYVFEDAVNTYNAALADFQTALAAFEENLANVNGDNLKIYQLHLDWNVELTQAYDDNQAALAKNKATLDAAKEVFKVAMYAHRDAMMVRDLAIENALYAVDPTQFNVTNLERSYSDDYDHLDEWCEWAWAVNDYIATMISYVNMHTTDEAPNRDDYYYEEDYLAAYEEYSAMVTKRGLYTTALSTIDNAKLAYDNPLEDNDPYSVWVNAKSANSAAEQKWQLAEIEANKVYAQAQREINAKYEQLTDGLTSPEYDNELWVALMGDSVNEGTGALSALSYAMSQLDVLAAAFTSLDRGVEGDYNNMYYTLVKVDAEGNEEYLTVTVPDVPKYLWNEEITTADVEAIVANMNADEFLAGLGQHFVNYIFDANVVDVVGYYDDGYNVYLEYDVVESIISDSILGKDCPFSYPSYEEYKAYVTATGKSYDNLVGLAYYYDLKMQNEADEALLASYDPETLKAYKDAVEAAQAAFEAFVTTTEAELDALKAEVEAAAPGLIAELKELEAELKTWEAKYGLLTRQLNILEEAIRVFVSDVTPEAADVEALVEYLELVYDDACAYTYQAETDLQKAKQNLEAMFDSEMDSVQFAQNDYDDIEAKLLEAMEKLEVATAALDAALERIGEDNTSVVL